MSNLYEYIKMAVHNIMANKGRSFLTMLGIIIGIASVIAIVSVGEGTKNQMNSEIDDIGGGQIAISVSDEAQTDEEWITADDVEAIRTVDGIEGVNVSDSFSGETTTGKGNFSLMLTGEGPDAKLLNNATMKHGVYFGENEVQEAKNVCVLSGGRGFVIRQQRTPFGVMQTQQPCSRCGGKGKLVKNPCKVCHGSGKTATRKTLEVSIPMGIDDDQSFALRGMGDAGANGGPAGDVIVMVTVRPSEVFQRDGYDVWVTVPITYSQAVLGDEITVPSIDGKVEYTVPEGTQSGTTFRLRGKGIQYLNGRGRGDMYVKCEVEIPKKLNKAQRDALKKFEGTLKEENYEKRKGFFKKLKDMFA